jgi:aryl carrier-like protein
VLVSKRPLAERFRTAAAPEAARGASPVAESSEAVRHARPALGNEYVAPRTDLERTLAEAWQRLLGIDRVGVTDNFFELGGESLSALRLVALLQEGKGLRLSLVRLYESPTIEGLALYLSGDTEGEAVLEASGRRGGSRAEALAERRQSRQAPPRPRAPGEAE